MLTHTPQLFDTIPLKKLNFSAPFVPRANQISADVSMHSTRHTGLGAGEILGFLILLAIGIAVALYLNQKPTVVVKNVIVQPNVPAAPIQEAAPPAPAEPVVVKAAPPAEISLPIERIVVAPTVRACVAIEKKLRIAQDAAVQIRANIAAAKQAALTALYQSPDYLAAKADKADKKEAKQAVADTLQKDRTTGADTDHDLADMQATSAAWVVSSGTLAKMEDDAIASDDQVNQQIQNLKDIKIQIAALQKQLGNYIAAEIHSVCKHSDCRIDNVSLDANDWMIYVEMTPDDQSNPGAMADAALHDIGAILETLTRTPFNWNTARFTVYNKSDTTRHLLEANTSKLMGDYFDDPKLISLAENIWLNPHIDQLQGRPPVPDSIIQRPGVPLPELFNTLAIGGYTRTDGSACPITLVHSPHTVEFARPDPPLNKTPSLPSPILNHTPQNPCVGF